MVKHHTLAWKNASAARRSLSARLMFDWRVSAQKNSTMAGTRPLCRISKQLTSADSTDIKWGRQFTWMQKYIQGSIVHIHIKISLLRFAAKPQFPAACSAEPQRPPVRWRPKSTCPRSTWPALWSTTSSWPCWSCWMWRIGPESTSERHTITIFKNKFQIRYRSDAGERRWRRKSGTQRRMTGWPAELLAGGSGRDLVARHMRRSRVGCWLLLLSSLGPTRQRQTGQEAAAQEGTSARGHHGRCCWLLLLWRRLVSCGFRAGRRHN